MTYEDYILEEQLLRERDKVLYELQLINRKIRNIRLPDQIINLYIQGWKIGDIAKKMKVSEVTVRNWLRKKGQNFYRPKQKHGILTKEEWDSRGMKIYIDKMQHKKTFVQIGRELGLSGNYVSVLFRRAERKIRREKNEH